MATVRNSLSLRDQTTPVLRKIVTAMESTIAVMAKIDNISDGAFNGMQKDVAAAKAAVDDFNNQIDGVPSGVSNAANSFSKFKNPLVTISAGIYAIRSAIQGLSTITGWSDQLVLTTARINLMNDGLQTTEELQRLIMESADRSRGSYTAMSSSVAKMGILAGEAFESNQEIVAFTELMTKSFKVGGAGIQEQTSAMYQLTQAMAAGKLQGDEFRSIMENAPMLAAAIAKYTGKSKGELKMMSSEGTITADIIKAAMFSAADDINSKFSSLPRTFADVGTLLQNRMVGAFQKVLVRMNSLINGVSFDKFLNGFVNAITEVANAALWGFDLMVKAGAWVSDNWSLIEPILWGLVVVLGVYNGIALVTNALLAIQAFQAKIAGAGLMFQSGATFAATVAQWGLNAAMWAFPGTWIVAAIVVIIAALVAFGVWLYNLWQKNMEFKYGVLALWEDIKYGMAGVFSVIQLMGNSVANTIELALANVVLTVQNKINDVIGLINMVISASNQLTGAKTALWDKLTFGDTYKRQVDANVAARNADVNAKIAADYNNHAAAEAKLASEKAAEVAKIAAGKNTAKDATKGLDLGKYQINGGKLDSIGKIDSDVSISDEDIKMMRDIAAVEFVNRYTTLRPEMNVSFGDVHETADVNKILETLESMAEEAYSSALVGA